MAGPLSRWWDGGTGGSTERAPFIKTLLNEWTYAMPFQTSNETNR